MSSHHRLAANAVVGRPLDASGLVRGTRGAAQVIQWAAAAGVAAGGGGPKELCRRAIAHVRFR